MTTATLAKPVTSTMEFALLPLSQPRMIDLKREHTQAGLDPQDIQYLDTPSMRPRSQARTFNGISIE